MNDPNGRVVMLSGATGGIGAAITRRLSEDGFRLSLGVRDVDKARETFPDFEAEGGLICRFEAGEADTAKAWVDATAEHFGRIDALINNAGILRQIFFDEGDEAGRITSAYLSPVDGKVHALAMLPLVLAESGTALHIGTASGSPAAVL